MILMPVHQRTQTKLSRATVQTVYTRICSTVVLLPPTHQRRQKTIADATACLCPNSCENNDARQMRMTDQETRHPSDVSRSHGVQKSVCKSHTRNIRYFVRALCSWPFDLQPCPSVNLCTQTKGANQSRRLHQARCCPPVL